MILPDFQFRLLSLTYAVKLNTLPPLGKCAEPLAGCNPVALGERVAAVRVWAFGWCR